LVERLGWQPRFADTATIIKSALDWERRLLA
jgi:UDP-glucose 4-epimerase